MEDKDFLVGRFCGVTGVSRERATFYLQAAGWNLESAIEAFYDAANEEEEDLGEPDVPLSTGVSSGASGSTSTPPVPPSSGNSGGRRGVATLSDYKNKPTDGKNAQQFYAGGSEHSGQMIEGPPRPNEAPKNITQGFIDAAKKQGAVPIEAEEEEEEQQQRAKPFQGTGFKLGDTNAPSPGVGTRGPLPTPPRQERVRHSLILWRDGFSVGDGPLRTGQTDEDKQFIESVQKGEIPEELRRNARHGEVDVDIKDQRDQNYVKPKPKMVAFSGEGRKLGSYAPSMISSSSGSSSSGGASNSASSVTTPPPTVPLDPSQPTTSLQIRLADGSRLTAKFNHTHTVNDIRQFIDISRPSTVNYILMTTFPNKELSDPTLTLSQANLLNAVIVQRIR